MTTQFYMISAEGQKTGPYDLVGMVKKIRNGSVQADTSISTDKDETPKRAVEWPELAEFLTEGEEEGPEDVVHKVKATSLSRRLNAGWNFLQTNQLSTIFSGLYVLFILFSVGVIKLAFPPALQMIGFGVCFVITQYFFTGYTYSVLRMVRGQPVDFNFVRKKMKPNMKGLLISSFFMSFFIIVGMLLIMSEVQTLAVVGLLVVALPGFFLMSRYIFAPLLILDKNVEFWEAMESSRKTVKKLGGENFGVIFSLLIINFLGGMLFLIPMIVTLPITISAISDMFDESFI